MAQTGAELRWTNEVLEKDLKSLSVSGMCYEFALRVTALCDEIRVLYGIEESVRQPDKDNLEEFLYDLSAFLLELECPHEDISCGEILSRFELPHKCESLVRFLLSEVKAARLYASKKLESGQTTSMNRDLELTPIIDAALSTLKVPHQSGNTNEWKVLESLRQKADSKLPQSQRKLLFTASFDQKSLQEIDSLIKILSRDFHNRLLLLSRRLKVTIESFMWCDRISSHESRIRQMLTDRLKEFETIKTNCDIAHLLSASSSLLYIQKASSVDRRSHTKSMKHPLAVSEPPKDRGGRTNEMVGIRRESFAQQNAQRHGQDRRGRGGGHRGGGHSNWQQQHQGQSHEQRILEQTVQRDFGGQGQSDRGHRGNRRGRGNQRGHYFNQ